MEIPVFIIYAKQIWNFISSLFTFKRCMIGNLKSISYLVSVSKQIQNGALKAGKKRSFPGQAQGKPRLNVNSAAGAFIPFIMNLPPREAVIYTMATFNLLRSAA
jgi:hypothetical protein